VRDRLDSTSKIAACVSDLSRTGQLRMATSLHKAEAYVTQSKHRRQHPQLPRGGNDHREQPEPVSEAECFKVVSEFLMSMGKSEVLGSDGFLAFVSPDLLRQASAHQKQCLFQLRAAQKTKMPAKGNADVNSGKGKGKSEGKSKGKGEGKSKGERTLQPQGRPSGDETDKGASEKKKKPKKKQDSAVRAAAAPGGAHDDDPLELDQQTLQLEAAAQRDEAVRLARDRLEQLQLGDVLAGGGRRLKPTRHDLRAAVNAAYSGSFGKRAVPTHDSPHHEILFQHEDNLWYKYRVGDPGDGSRGMLLPDGYSIEDSRHGGGL
jgi:hypothetical protein